LPNLALEHDAEPIAPLDEPHPSVAPPGDSGSGAPQVLVVFVDHVVCPWLHLLQRGFRHCFVVLRTGPLWLACEPLKDRIELDVLDLPSGFDLARFYGEQGHRVLLGRRPSSAPRRRFALAPLTCVTIVKRLLGINAPWVCIPSQLYTHLAGPTYGFRPWSDTPEVAQNGGVHEGETGPNAMLDMSGI
jgi:hypothetical protein